MSRLAAPLFTIALALPLALPLPFAATPAAAAGRPSCDDMYLGDGVNVGFGITFKFGTEIRKDRSNDYSAMMELRRRGIEARTVTHTEDGCLQVLQRTPDGGWDTKYYHPVTYEWVYG